MGRLQRFPRNPSRQMFDALALLEIAPELLVKPDRLETLDSVLQRHLTVGIPEKCRVAQPRREHAFVIARHVFFIAGVGVGHHQERGLHLAGIVDDGKIVLMMNHRRRQHFFRQAEELLRERSRHDRRIFDQIRHFFEERRMQHRGAADAPAEGPGFRLEAARDAALALLPIEDDEVFGQSRLVILERPHLHRASCSPAGGQMPMTVGDRRGNHFLDRRRLGKLGAPDGERHDAAAIQIENPPDGTSEQQLPFAIFEERIPAHRLGKIERAQCRGENLGQDIHGRFPALMPAIPEIGSLRRLDPLRLRDVDAVLLRKAHRGSCGLASRVKRGGNRGTHEQLLEIGLPLRNFRDARGQPSRRAVALDRRVGRKPMRAHGAVQTVADLPGQPGQPRRRHFFGPYFQEQFTFHLLSRGPRPGRIEVRRYECAGSATYACAMAIAI